MYAARFESPRSRESHAASAAPMSRSSAMVRSPVISSRMALRKNCSAACRGASPLVRGVQRMSL